VMSELPDGVKIVGQRLQVVDFKAYIAWAKQKGIFKVPKTTVKESK
jgi:hypothetical protein